jgi:hypothetical protein
MAHTTANWEVWKPEIDAYVMDEMDNLPQSLYEQVFDVGTTNRLQWNEKTFSGYSPMQEVGDLGNAEDDETLDGYKFSYARRSYRKKAEFSSDFLETAQTKEVENRAKDFARVVQYSRDLHVFEIFRKAWDSGVTYGDGVPLVSPSHPRKDGGGNQSNTFADGVQRPLSYDAVAELQDVLISNVSNSGNLMAAGAPGRNKVLWTSPYQKEVAFQIAGVDGPDQKPGTDENDANYFIRGDKYDVLLIDWITYEAARQENEHGGVAKTSASNYWDTMWGVMDKELCQRFFKVYVGEGYEQYDDDLNKDNQVYIKYAYDKFAYGVTNWIGFAGSKGDGTTVS